MGSGSHHRVVRRHLTVRPGTTGRLRISDVGAGAWRWWLGGDHVASLHGWVKVLSAPKPNRTPTYSPTSTPTYSSSPTYSPTHAPTKTSNPTKTSSPTSGPTGPVDPYSSAPTGPVSH
jgi:hypothetical protein